MIRMFNNMLEESLFAEDTVFAIAKIWFTKSAGTYKKMKNG